MVCALFASGFFHQHYASDLRACSCVCAGDSFLWSLLYSMVWHATLRLCILLSIGPDWFSEETWELEAISV